jgi:hypothetical protein
MARCENASERSTPNRFLPARGPSAAPGLPVTLLPSRKVHRVEALWTKIVGILLILLGVTLFASPFISYTTSERLTHTPLSVKREKTLTVTRPVSVLIIVAGVVTLLLGSRSPR